MIFYVNHINLIDINIILLASEEFLQYSYFGFKHFKKLFLSWLKTS